MPFIPLSGWVFRFISLSIGRTRVLTEHVRNQAVVVAYQVGEFKYGFPDVTKVSPISPQSVIEDPPATETMFLDVVGVLIKGTLVPVIVCNSPSLSPGVWCRIQVP